MLRNVMTSKEASILWGVPVSTLHSALKGQKGCPPRFTEEEYAKSGSNWLITVEGMTRVYGAPKK